MNRVLLTFAAAAVLAVALPAAAPAAQSWEDISTQTALAALDSAPAVRDEPGIAWIRFPVPVRPDASAPAFIISFVEAGLAQTGVPCFNCVSGAQTSNNIGLTGPYNYIASGEVAQYTGAYTNLSNTGNCTFSWAIAAGKTKLDSFSYVLKTPSKDGSYTVGFNRNRPSYSGPAVLTMKIACVGSGAQTTKTTLYYE